MSPVVFWLGSRAQSLEQAAAKTAELPAGWIPAEVEQRVLSSTSKTKVQDSNDMNGEPDMAAEAGLAVCTSQLAIDRPIPSP